MDNEIRTYLKNRPPQLNFKDLIKFIEDCEIPIENKLLINSVGVATLDCIWLDVSKLSNISDSVVFFIILHEIGHYKRIKKLGRNEIIRKLSINDFRDFNNDIISEEMIADRYGSLLFLKFNGFPFPRILTQNLEDEYNRRMYSLKTAKYFGIIKHSEENYYKLINNYII